SSTGRSPRLRRSSRFCGATEMRRRGASHDQARRHPDHQFSAHKRVTNNQESNNMSLLAEGIWPCTVLSANAGQNDKGAPQVQINVRIDDGPSKGRQCTYEDQVNNKSAPYIGRSCKAVGWRGHSLVSLHDDAVKWIAETGGKSTVEIKHLEIKTGKRAGQIWDKP